MWCETHAREPFATQNVLLSSAPVGEDRPPRRARQRDPGRHVAARAADRPRPARRDAHDRVVGAHVDRPVVQEERLGDAGQPRDGVLVVVGDRLVGDVAARHHQRHAVAVGQQQVVQRRVREHHPELPRPRRHRRGHAGPGQPRREHDRPLARAQQRLLLRPRLDQRGGGLDVGRHQRERLVLAVLARPQRPHRALVVGAARQVVAAQPLDRQHRPAEQRRHRRLDRTDASGCFTHPT